MVKPTPNCPPTQSVRYNKYEARIYS
jgi:hypothetical protein